MSFRARILIGLGLIFLFPLAVFELRVRADMADRLTAQYQRRVASLVAGVPAGLSRGRAGGAGRAPAPEGGNAAGKTRRLAPLLRYARGALPRSLAPMTSYHSP